MRWLDGITNSKDESEQASGVRDDREGWRAAVHGVAKCRTWLSDLTETGRRILGSGLDWAIYISEYQLGLEMQFYPNISNALWMALKLFNRL